MQTVLFFKTNYKWTEAMQPLYLIQLTFIGTCNCNQLNAVRMQCTFLKLTKIILLTTVQFTFSIHHQSGGM